jgi:hypothetical protein
MPVEGGWEGGAKSSKRLHGLFHLILFHSRSRLLLKYCLRNVYLTRTWKIFRFSIQVLSI